MQRMPLSGGSLIWGVASRRALFVSFPSVAFHYRRCRVNKLCASALAHEDQAGISQSLQLEHVLEQLRKAQGIDRLGPNVEAVVAGRGKHLGIAVTWNLRWTASGCFAEEIRGPQLTFKWGYDGRKDSGCWEVDSSGLVRVMECDDHEAVLMTTYIRTGCWLQPHLQDRFEIELLPTPIMPVTAIGSGGSSSSSSAENGRRGNGVSPGTAAERADDPRVQNMELAASASPDGRSSPATAPPDYAAAAAKAAATASSASAAASVRSTDIGGFASGGGGGSVARKTGHATHGSRRSTPGTAPASDDVLAIGLRLKGRKLRVRVLVRRGDWRLLAFDHRMCADVETWELGEWREWAEGVQYPSSALHKASNGGQHAYLTGSGTAELTAPLPPLPDLAAVAAGVAAPSSNGLVDVDRSPPLTSSFASRSPGSSALMAAAAPLLLPPPTEFGLPLLPPIPADTIYSINGGREAVPLWRSASGHYLVRPAINGQPGGGYFVLDTGASGFVVTPQAAARLGGQSFGETHAASISGKVAARFVRLSSWSLGGLCIRQPVLMVMALEGLVRGAPGEVVGIVGHDLFRRAVLELPQLLGPKSSTAAAGESSGCESGSECRSGSGSEEDCAMLPLEAASSFVRGEVAPPSTSALYLEGGGGGPQFGPSSPAPRSTPAFNDAGVLASARTGWIGNSTTGGQPCASLAAPPLGPPVSIAAATCPSPSVLVEGPLPASGRPTPPPSSSSSLPSASLEPSTLHLEGPAPSACSSNKCSSSSSSSSSVSYMDGSMLASDIGVRKASTSSTNNSTSSRSSRSRSSNRNCLGHGSSVGEAAETGSTESLSSGGNTSRLAADAAASSSSSSKRNGSVGGGGGSVTRASAARSTTARAVRRAARTVPYTLHEMVVHHPLEYENESKWVWEPLVMIANLPHVHLRFADPTGGPPRSALLMVDSGACGADLMLHARAQKELGLTGAARGPESGVAGGGAPSQGHYLRGVGQDPKDFVQLQVLDLPWLEVAGVHFEQVRCMCAAVGGLDISIYSHGILCGDLLARLEWAMDYTHKRIGFRRGAYAPAPSPPR